MNNIIDHLIRLLGELLPHIPDHDINRAFWNIITTLIQLAYISTVVYWLLKLLETLHQIGFL
jgi:hypothetical protein